MSLSLHTLAPHSGSRPRKTRVGRGYASGRGTTAGRGTKGQRARTGGRKRLKLKGLKQMLLAFPKTRGFQSTFPEVTAIPTARLMAAFPAEARIDVLALKKAHLMPKSAVYAKVIGNGVVEKAFVLVGIRATASAKAAIEKAGGRFEALAKREAAKKKAKKATSKKSS